MAEVLYLKIVAEIRDNIIKGEYKPGDMLKSETALMSEYGVGRMTIRRSIALLANQGYVYSVPGKGSFVCQSKNDPLELKFSKYEGYQITINQIKLVGVQVINPEGFIREQLNLKLKEKVVKVERYLCSGKEKIAVETIFFPYKKNEPVIEDVLKFSNYMERLEENMAFAMKKKIIFKVKMLSKEMTGKFSLNKPERFFEVQETILNTDLQKVVSYTILYINPEYLILEAETYEENGHNIY